MAFPAYQNITSLNTAKTLTVPEGTRRVIVQANTQAVYYTLDGTTPANNNGLVLAAGESVEIEGIALSGFKAIEVTSGAVLKVCYLQTGHIRMHK